MTSLTMLKTISADAQNSEMDELSDLISPLTPRMSGRLSVGQPVEVRTHFVGEWVHGFAVQEVLRDGYRLTRKSDGSTLPVVIPEVEIRPAYF